MSVSTWDCSKLVGIVNESGNEIDAASCIRAITKFERRKTEGNLEEHYFIVEMNGIQGNLNALLNVPLVKAYVSQVAPVPFHPQQFSFGNEIEAHLKENVPLYNTYRIFVDGEIIYKPFSDIFRANDSIQRIERPRFIFLNEGARDSGIVLVR